MTQLEFMRQHVNKHSIWRVPPGGPKLPGKRPGTEYSWQFYLRRSLYDPLFLRCLVEFFFETMGQDRLKGAQLAGVESAAVPMLIAFVRDWLPAFSIRKERKKYGLMNWVEGMAKHLPVILVDDLISPNHYTMRHGVKILGELGMEIKPYMFCVVDKRRDEKTPIEIDGQKFEVISPFTLNDFDLYLT